jgi:hypothetical protein
MDSKSFVKVMRKLISEEVRKAVRAEMRILLKEQKIDHEKSMSHGLQIYHEAQVPKSKPRTSDITFTKDSLLNDLLNETAMTMNPGELYGDTPMVSRDTLSFGSNDAQGFGMMRNGYTATPPVTDINNNPVNISNEKVATVVNNITKDYSALLKAIDKKKGI